MTAVHWLALAFVIVGFTSLLSTKKEMERRLREVQSQPDNVEHSRLLSSLVWWIVSTVLWGIVSVLLVVWLFIPS
ncbi:hypothetical protein FLK61_27465 [Paenalkalicoccus suaedae]|uniref:Uncharacterized protein n=1 Tax=Paenalkalicoccus suaedae TaxID=2592382 RepID=A0A859FD45_9BACI|nr:hypothetical protein [Paenalkalicoccus suaedae]QKS70494.1 hypothetical protein FLK61_27465 [Paenalkalicoccus suaedae]